jgi:acetoin utilization deacetylase AcuC-like enzyme
LLRAHTLEHLARLQVAQDFDSDTPFHDGIMEFARLSCGGALAAMESCLAGESVFCLMRPPGHHATRSTAMGFCYLSSMAIAVLEAKNRGAQRVAVLDFDVHHGNGTEDILLYHPGTAFYSVHQHPCYPGTGTADVGDNCHNYPVPPDPPREHYRRILSTAIEDLLRFKPTLIGVSAGFDAYARDPLAQGTLETEDFYWLGATLRKAGVPVFSILEGGYSNDLPQLIIAFLKGIEGQ